MAYTRPAGDIGEVPGYPRQTMLSVDTGEFGSVRKVIVDWSLRWDWANYFIYNHEANGSQPDPYMVIAGYNNFSSIWGVLIEPVASTQITHGIHDTAEAEYVKAYITLTYVASGFRGGEIVMEEMRTGLQSIPITNYLANGTRISDSFPMSVTTYIRRYPRKLVMPSSPVYLPSLVNLEVFTFIQMPVWVATGCALYSGGKVAPSIWFDGVVHYDVQHEVLIRPFDWNYVWDHTTGNWVMPMRRKHAYTVFSTLM